MTLHGKGSSALYYNGWRFDKPGNTVHAYMQETLGLIPDGCPVSSNSPLVAGTLLLKDYNYIVRQLSTLIIYMRLGIKDLWYSYYMVQLGCYHAAQIWKCSSTVWLLSIQTYRIDTELFNWGEGISSASIVIIASIITYTTIATSTHIYIM